LSDRYDGHSFIFFPIICNENSPHLTLCFLYTRSGTGSNEPIPLQCVVLVHFQEDAGVQTVAQEPSAATVWTPRRKIGMKRSLLQLGETRFQLTQLAQLQTPEARSSCCWNEQKLPPCCFSAAGRTPNILWYFGMELL
jgi:hypothetical protein